MRSFSNHRKRKPPLLTAVAMCGLRKVLRPFIRPEGPAFVAVLVVPPTGTLEAYRDAAHHLFGKDSSDYDVDHDFTALIVDDEKEQDRLATMKRLSTAVVRSCSWPSRANCPTGCRLPPMLSGSFRRPSPPTSSMP